MPNLLKLWIAIALTTIIYAIFMGRRIDWKTMGLSLGGATAFTLLGYFLPGKGQFLTMPEIGLRWLINLVIFTAAFRLGLRANWRRSIGAGFFAATCLVLLQLLG
ncbi:MAG TPA: hypothetical protein GX528_01690 [Firmicutes bacterium]|nr:hypothetical protein [Bacillota bacterium]